jgi:EmrB/QacA subfamily drug resistance transporter
MASMLLAALDQNVVTTALPTIAGRLGGIAGLSWAVTAYLLAMTAATPLYGKLSDRRGGKPVLLAAIAIFVAGSLGAGLSQNMAELTGARAVQGAGAGGIIAMTFTIGSSVIPPRQIGRYQGYSGILWSLATLTGPLIGGSLAQHGAWRWIFFLNVPVGLAALAITATALRLPGHRRHHRTDYPGAALLMAAAACLLLVTAWGGQRYAWGSWQIVGLACAGAVIAAAFVIRQRYAAEPLLALPLLADPVLAVCVAASFLVGLAMFAVVLFLPVYLQVVKGIAAGTSGVFLLPLWGAVTLASFTTGFLIAKTGRYKGIIVAGTALIALGSYLFAGLGPGTSSAVIFGCEAIVGCGLGAVISKLIMAAQNAVERTDLGTAISATQFFRELGGALGTALFGAVFAARLGYWRQRLLPHAAVAYAPGTRAPAASIQVNPGSAERLRATAPLLYHEVGRMVTLALHPVFLLAVPFAAAAFAVAWLLPRRHLKDAGWRAADAGPEDETTPVQPVP